MEDEARHVAFGRLTLRDYYRDLGDAERAERARSRLRKERPRARRVALERLRGGAQQMTPGIVRPLRDDLRGEPAAFAIVAEVQVTPCQPCARKPVAGVPLQDLRVARRRCRVAAGGKRCR